jgi:hypothetical protein
LWNGGLRRRSPAQEQKEYQQEDRNDQFEEVIAGRAREAFHELPLSLLCFL